MEVFWKHLNIKSSQISLIEAGMQKFTKNQDSDYIVKKDFILHAVIDGEGYYKINGKQSKLTKNDGFILKKNNHVQYWPSKANPWTTIWIGIGGSDLNSLLANTILLNCDTFHYQNDSIVFNHLKEFVSLINTESFEKENNDLYILSHLYLLLHEIQQEFVLPSIDKSYRYLEEPELIELIYNYIYETYAKGVTIEQIADHFGINRNYLFHLCKAYFDQSPKQMVQELRMNKASQLLRHTSLQIKEIASQIGYTNSLVFSKMFKAYFSYSPSEFRALPEDKFNQAVFNRKIVNNYLHK